MRKQKTKQADWTMPFKIVPSKIAFDQLEISTHETMTSGIQNQPPQNPPSKTKEQIFIPQIKTIDEPTGIRKIAKSQPNYHRMKNQQNFMNPFSVELSEVDYHFIQLYAKKFVFCGQIILTAQFLSKVFVHLEKTAGRSINIPLSNLWLVQYFNEQYQHLKNWELVDLFINYLYSFWRGRRESAKFPLLRSLWKPSSDDSLFIGAFKERQQEKRNLRRLNRMPEDEIVADLQEEFNLAIKIVERIKIREELKAKEIQLQIHSFHSRYSEIFKKSQPFKEALFENRTKEKQKLKKMKEEYEKTKTSYIPQAEDESVTQSIVNVKASIGEFLSTVIHHVHQSGIVYDKVFQQKSLKKVVVQKEKSEEELLKKSERVAEENWPIKENFPEDYMEYKAGQVRGYYFAEDDDVELKDLKKSLTQNFKQFINNKKKQS